MDQLTRDARALVDRAKPRDWQQDAFWLHLEELLHRLEEEDKT